MLFFKYQNRLFLAKFISFREAVRTSLCEYCRFAEKDCIGMKNQKKCVECIRRGRFCVSISLEALNHAYEKLQIQLQTAEKKFARVLSQVNRLQKQIKLNKSHTAQKMQCVAAKLDSDNDDFENETVDKSPSLFQIVDNLFSDFWQFFDFVENLSVIFDNFWDARLVLKCFQK